MAKKKVALALSGGVSLGSYIAGALDELLLALEADGGYEIDVITGASAGATTAAILAYWLLFGGPNTRLHDVWVKQADMHRLLDPACPPDQPLTVLSNAWLTEIASRTLAWPEGSPTPRRSGLCADQLTIAMTITNIEGLSYTARVQMLAAEREEPLVQRRHAEMEAFTFFESIKPTDPIWRRVGEVAIASAALPLIFPPSKLARRAEPIETDDYLQQFFVQPPELGDQAEATLLYSDGGIFNNLPIDLAWHFARDKDTDQRIMIIVDPSRDAITPLDMRKPEQRPAYANPLHYLKALFGALRAESSAIQFQREVLLTSQESGSPRDLRGSLPGVDRPPVEILHDIAVVMPQASDRRLLGSYLGLALSAFLDERLREYDFRRGAADARTLANTTLHLPAVAGRSPSFYKPNEDTTIAISLPTYEQLGGIISSHDRDLPVGQRRSVRTVFEADLHARLNALIDRMPLPGPAWLYGWLARPLARWLAWRKLRAALPRQW